MCPAIRAALRPLCGDDSAAQIAEFAVSLPLLVVFVVGIFDFTNAISLKQKLMSAAREAARVAASDPATDLSASVPVSVSDAQWVVDRYLISEKIDDCGLSAVTPTTSGHLQWVSASTGNGCPGNGISLTVDRGCKSQITTGATTVNLIETCITLSYDYNWEFNRVIGLLSGNANGPGTLTAKAAAFDEN